MTVDEIVTGEGITPSQRQELVEILNKYRCCIAKNLYELGLTDKIEMDIEFVPGSEHVTCKPYKLNATEREDFDNIVTDYKPANIVKETNSPNVSPAFIVRDKNGKPRMVVDYRGVNGKTVKIRYPMPSFDDGLEFFLGAKMFVILDLASGFLQIPLAESAKAKTAFITEFQTGQFEQVNFGLTNAPFYFAKLIKKVLGHNSGGIAFNFFDDTCIPAKSWSEIMRKLIVVLELLKDAHLTLNLSKCRFGMERVEFHGFEISGEGIRPSRGKTAAIGEFPAPRNAHEIRRFLGLAGFFRRFVPGFAEISAPLTGLTKGDVAFV